MNNVGDQASIGVWNRWSRKYSVNFSNLAKGVGDMFFKGVLN